MSGYERIYLQSINHCSETISNISAIQLYANNTYSSKTIFGVVMTSISIDEPQKQS